MAKRAGEIVINIRAGNAKLKTDLGAAQAAFKEFGRGSVSGVQATSSALRLMEGNITNNIRASERFLANVLHLGPVLQAAFPLVGGLAFGGLLAELGTKAVNFFKTVQDGPQKIGNAFADLASRLRVTNDGLRVTGARLDNEIAQLQGKPTNNLRVAVLETKEAVDQLNESLQTTLKDAYKALTETPGAGNWFQRLGNRLLGNADYKDVAELIGGPNGLTGFELQTRTLQGPALQQAYAAQIKLVEDKLKEAEARQSAYNASTTPGKYIIGDQSDEIAALEGYLTDLKNQQEQIVNTSANNTKKITVAKLQDKVDAAGLGKPFQDKIKELDAQLANAKAKLDSIGESESGRVLAEGYGKAAQVIAEVNKVMEKRHTQLTINEADAIRGKEVQIALTEAETAWKEKFTQATDALNDRIAAQQRLNAAIGGTYAQQRSAAVENGIAQAVGAKNYNDLEFMKTHASEIAALRGQLGREYDTQQAGRSATSLLELQDKIRLTNAMAAAERNGAEAVKQAELAERIRVATRGLDADAARKLEQAMMAEYNAERQNEAQKELETLREQATALDRLAAAYGHKARVQAEAQNAYDAAIRAGKTPEVAKAESSAVTQKDQDEVLTKAHEMASAYSDQIDMILRTEAALRNIAKTYGDTLAIEKALRDLEAQRLQIQTQMSNSVKAGLQSVWADMAAQAKTTAQAVHDIFKDALTSAIDESANNLASMLTGQKSKHESWKQVWGKEFQGIGHQMIASSLKNTFLHLAGMGEKGSKQNPVYVKDVDSLSPGATPGVPGNAVPNPLGGLGGVIGKIGGGLFGSGSQGGGVFSLLGNVASQIAPSIPGLADGGDVYPGGSYIVGDGGEPEVFSPKTAGTITPAHKIGGHTYHMTYNVDARGAQVGVEARIAQAIEEAHKSAVITAVRANHEQKWRTPQRSGH